MNDGGYVERRVVGDDVTYTSTGTWVQTGNVLKVHINSMVVRSETYNYTYTDPKDYTYNILWKDDGRFELRYEIENWKKNRKKFSSEATCYYDSDGTFRSQETIKQLFTTQTVIFSETAKIFSRVYN